MTTGDHVRKIRQALQIFEVENGGFPENLEVVERRYGPIPPFFKADGWDRPIAYTVSRPRGTNENGERIFTACELRSAGSNGKPGDEDDIVWRGEAER